MKPVIGLFEKTWGFLNENSLLRVNTASQYFDYFLHKFKAGYSKLDLDE